MSGSIDPLEAGYCALPFSGHSRVSHGSSDDNSNDYSIKQEEQQSSRSSWSEKSMDAIVGVVGTLRNSFKRLSHIGESRRGKTDYSLTGHSLKLYILTY